MYRIEIEGEEMVFKTEDSLFSPAHADKGTLAMLSAALPGIESYVSAQEPDDTLKILDLGCGCGIAGIFLARKFPRAEVVFTDVEPKAVAITGTNAAQNLGGTANVTFFTGDAYSAVPCRDFDFILSNPPYHTDFSVAKRFIEGAFTHLKTGGALFMVTKRKDWYLNKLKAVFGGCRVTEADGYFVFEAVKKSPERPKKKTAAEKNPSGMSQKLLRKSQKRAGIAKNKEK